MRLALDHLKLRVSGPKTLRFYTDLLGLQLNESLRYSLEEQDFGLEFEFSEPSEPYKLEAHHGYWKLGLTTNHVDSAYRFLTNRGWRVSNPLQFRDIGYLCHLRDPDGLNLELLQHDFGKPLPNDSAVLPELRIAHVTLRIADPQASLDFYQNLGLKLLSIQPVVPHRFTLFFLADTQEAPPNNDLQAVSNRPWLWRRPYPVLELQHCWDLRPEPAQNTELGYVHLGFKGGSQLVHDPDGHALMLPPTAVTN